MGLRRQNTGRPVHLLARRGLYYSVLESKVIPSPSRTHSFPPTAVGRYLYVNLTGGFRYTYDLIAHRLVADANKNVVSLAVPSYLPIR